MARASGVAQAVCEASQFLTPSAAVRGFRSAGGGAGKSAFRILLRGGVFLSASLGSPECPGFFMPLHAFEISRHALRRKVCLKKALGPDIDEGTESGFLNGISRGQEKSCLAFSFLSGHSNLCQSQALYRGAGGGVVSAIHPAIMESAGIAPHFAGCAPQFLWHICGEGGRAAGAGGGWLQKIRELSMPASPIPGGNFSKAADASWAGRRESRAFSGGR